MDRHNFPHAIHFTVDSHTNQVVSTTSSVYGLRPNLVGSPAAVYGSSLAKTAASVTGYLNSAGIQVPAGTQLFGNAGRNNLRGPAFGQFDLAAQKRFTLITEAETLAFRIEAFNVFNATNFISPDSNVSDGAAFGSLSSANVFPSRQVQLALRLAF